MEISSFSSLTKLFSHETLFILNPDGLWKNKKLSDKNQGVTSF